MRNLYLLFFVEPDMRIRLNYMCFWKHGLYLLFIAVLQITTDLV